MEEDAEFIYKIPNTRADPISHATLEWSSILSLREDVSAIENSHTQLTINRTRGNVSGFRLEVNLIG